jgi:hypothetical protein
MRYRSLALGLLPFALACGSDDEQNDNPWENRSYKLEIPATHWSEPPQIGNEIGAFVPAFVLQVSGSAPDDFTVMVGTADATGAQDLCSVTSEFRASSADRPSVQIGPASLAVHLVHPTQPVEVDASIYDMTMTDILPDGATPAEAGEFAAIIDARELYPLFTLLPEPSAEAVCAALDSYMASCVPCPSDGESFCLPLKAVDLGANEVAGGSVVPVDVATRDPSCP